MTGHGPAGELTFGDLRRRLAGLSGRLAADDADRDRAAAEQLSDASEGSAGPDVMEGG